MPSTVFNTSGPKDWHVLVLLDPNEGDLLGIWGPYESLAEAEIAREELTNWPLSPGTWEVIRVKKYPVPGTQPAYTTVTNTRGADVTWTSSTGDFFINPPQQ